MQHGLWWQLSQKGNPERHDIGTIRMAGLHPSNVISQKEQERDEKF
jgi:hypothetical protein